MGIHSKPGREKVAASFTDRHTGFWLLLRLPYRVWDGLFVLCISAALTYCAHAQVSPRTVADIFALLDQQPGSSVNATRAREILSRKPPAKDAARDTQMEFHSARASAAASLGRIATVIDERRVLVALTEGDRNQPKHLIDLAVTEMTAGNWSQAEQMVRRVVNSSSTWWGQDIAASALQSRMQSFLGDVASARTPTEYAEQMLRRGASAPMAASFLDLANALIAWAQADTFLADGDALAAERALRRAKRLALADTKIAASREDAIELAPAQDVTWQLLDLIQAQLIRLHVQQGRMQEAEIDAREMISRNVTRFGRSSPSTAIALTALADVLASQGRYAEAGALAENAMKTLVAAGAKASSGFTFYAQRIGIDSCIGRKDWNEAAIRIDQLRAQLKGNAFMLRSTERQANWALALLRAGRPDNAVDWLSRLVLEQERHLGAGRYETAESRGLLGAALAATGDRVRAFEAFAAAIPVLIARRRGAEADTEDALRRQRRRAILEAYLGLLQQSQSARGAGAVAEAFRYGDAALGGGAVQGALAASAARAMASTPQLGDLIRGEQGTKLELGSLNDRLLQLSTAAESERRDKAVAQLRQRIRDVESRRNDLHQRIESDFPDYANLVSPQPATLGEVQKSLRTDEAMVLIVPGDTQTFVWTVANTGAAAFYAAALPAHELSELVRSLRLALDPGEISVERLRGFDHAAAHRLYAHLLQPGEGTWRNAKTLVVVTDGALSQLPLSVLLTQQVQTSQIAQGSPPFSDMKTFPWLARKVAVANVPSANAFVRLRSLPQASARRTAFAGFGDPLFSGTVQPATVSGTRLRTVNIPRLSNTINATRQSVNYASYAALTPLPDTRDEVRSIARALGADIKTDVYLGAQASRRTVRSLDLTQRRVVAFATHGLVAGDLPGLTQPALALSATDDPGESPLLTLEDVLGLKLNADWVVLSACNTAAGDGAGAEAVSGLGRGFFYAGSRALLLTHWPVETVSARLLVTEIFRRYAKNPDISRAQALNEAMLAILDSPGTSDYSYAHPLFWAAYALFGDSGR